MSGETKRGKINFLPDKEQPLPEGVLEAHQKALEYEKGLLTSLLKSIEHREALIEQLKARKNPA